MCVRVCIYLKSKLPPHILSPRSLGPIVGQRRAIFFFFAYLFPRASPEIQVTLACAHTHAATAPRCSLHGGKTRPGFLQLRSEFHVATASKSPLHPFNVTDHRFYAVRTMRHTRLLPLY